VSRVLVTGAGGFIGAHLAARLRAEGEYVRVVDLKYDGYLKEPYYDEKVAADLRDLQACNRVTKGIDEVFNLAANMGGIGYITAIGADVMRDNALINLNMVEASRLNEVKRYFFSSSACIYPTYKQQDPILSGLKENDAFPADPDNFYGWEKIFAEKLYEAYFRDHGMNIRMVRFHNIYGPEGTYKGGREKSPAALCRKVVQSTDPGQIEIWGDGKQSRTYCYVDDAVEGALKVMRSDVHEPVNVGTDRLVSIDDLADIIIRISGKELSKYHNTKAPQGVRGRSADLTFVKGRIGWEPKVSLEEGLRRTYEWIEMMCNRDGTAIPPTQESTQTVSSRQSLVG
jgi:nucleoside-diphosphate-sugar epimerase